MTKRSIWMVITVALLALLLAACGGSETPTASPAAPEATEAAATEVPGQDVPAGTDEAWSRISEAGRMVVGTSADYPPFAYYTPNFELTGYDVALMRAIGATLGVQVEFEDMAFQGLLDALRLGQFDVAAAAISVTPERAGVVDFSNVYYVGDDAVLAANDAGLGEIRSAADMAGLRVGVEQDSVYESWAEENLVEPGLIPQENLLVYGQPEQGIDDLEAGRVDVVLLDRLPAEVAVANRAVAIVGQGLNRQRFAIAIPKGEPTLLGEINGALTQLQNEGVLADLAQQYLELEQGELIPVTPEPPVVTPQPTPAGCIDGMEYVADLTMNDQNMTAPPVLAPGQSFQKAWRVRNTGTCTWNSSYALAYVTGNVPAARMGGTPVFVQGEVLPGQTYDFRANLVAPTSPGTYQGFWEMRNGRGQSFGERVWVGIRVPSPATPTPAATQTPSPDITFTVDRTQINQGECVTFSWDVENIQAVYFYPSGSDYQRFGVPGQGSSRQCPPSNTTYELRVLKRDGSTEIRQITIQVNPTSGAPQITTLRTEPQSQITVGQCLTVRWEVIGSVDNVRLSRNGTTLWNGAPLRGSLQDCPPSAGFASYVLEASGPGGSTSLTYNVSVFD